MTDWNSVVFIQTVVLVILTWLVWWLWRRSTGRDGNLSVHLPALKDGLSQPAERDVPGEHSEGVCRESLQRDFPAAGEEESFEQSASDNNWMQLQVSTFQENRLQSVYQMVHQPTKSFSDCTNTVVADTVQYINHQGPGNERLHTMKKTAEKFMREVNPTLFVTIQAAKNAVEQLTDLGVIIITGCSGSGKTSLGLHLLHKVSQLESRQALVMTHPHQWEDIPQPEDRNKIKPSESFVVMVDDMFGKSNVFAPLQKLWEHKFKSMWPVIESSQIKIILIFRLQIYKQLENSLGQYTLFRPLHVLNLGDNKYKLTSSEKRNILEKYLGMAKIKLEDTEISAISKGSQEKLGFPQCCKFFAGSVEAQKRGVRFFQKPIEYLTENMNIMKEENPSYYLLLLLVMFNHGCLQLKCLNVFSISKELVNLIDTLKQICRVQSTTIGELEHIVRCLDGSYLSVENDCVRFSHQSVFDTVFMDFCQKFQKEGVEICPVEMLVEYVVPYNSACPDAVTVQLKDENRRYLHDRILAEMTTGDFKQVIDHPVLSDPAFVQFCSEKKNSLKSVITRSQEKKVVKTRFYFHQLNNQAIAKAVVNKQGMAFPPIRIIPVAVCQAEFSLCYIILANACLLSKEVILLLNDFLQPEESQKQKDAALVCACYIGSANLVDAFLGLGANPTLDCVRSACFSSVDNGNVVKTVINHLSSAECTADDLSYLLCCAMQCGNTDISKVLISKIAEKKEDTKALDWAINQLVVQCNEQFREFSRVCLGINLPNSDKVRPQELFSFLRKSGGKCFPDGLILIAGTHKDTGIIEELLCMGGKVTARDCTGQTPLHVAAMHSSLKVIRYLVNKGSDMKAVDDEGQTVLHKVARSLNAVDLAKYLVENGAFVNAVDRQKRTAMHVAACCESWDLVRFFTKQDVSVNAVDNEGQTVLHKAAWCERSDMVRYLVENGSDVNVADCDGQTPLHKAACLGSVETVKYLAEKMANVNAVDNEGNTVLHIAVDWDSIDKVRCLFEKGANVKAVNNNGETALHIAGRKELWNIIEYLIEKGADLNAVDHTGKTVLHYIVCYKSCQNVRYLIEKGADLNAADRTGQTVLHLAVASESVEIVKYLIAMKCDVNAADGEGRTPLHISCYGADMDTTNVLLENHAIPNARDQNGNTPLHFAVSLGDMDLIQLLTDSGSDNNVTNKDGLAATDIFGEHYKLNLVLQKGICVEQDQTDKSSLPFGYLQNEESGKARLHQSKLKEAVLFGNMEEVEFFLQEGYNVHATDKNGNTLIHFAALLGRTGNLKFLKEFGTDPSIRNSDGCTALHIAAFWGWLDTVRLLLKMGVDPDIAGCDGCTALHGAVTMGHSEVVQILVEQKASVNIHNNRGQTPYVVAGERISQCEDKALKECYMRIKQMLNDANLALD